MARLSKTDIKTKLDDYALRAKRIATLERKMAVELEPAVKNFTAATQPINDYYQPKLTKLREEKAAIEKEIVDWLKVQKKDVVVETELAIAERKKGLAGRVVDVKKFLEQAKAKGEAAMHECINILVGKAEKLLGKKELDAISTRPPGQPSTTVRMK